ncbi:MAG: hypothetical protein ACOYWZ_04500 [Bacillota bacterium]
MWKYGDSWEKYPINEGEIWKELVTSSILSVCDIRKELPNFILDNIDMVYCDPPWSRENVNAFITKAEMNTYIKDFREFYEIFFKRISQINPRVCYLEIGKKNKEIFEGELSKIFPYINFWKITYYKTHPCYLLRGSFDLKKPFDFTGKDEENIPMISIKIENPKNIADLCTGRGLTAIAAFKQKISFRGTELNKRRLAVTIDRVNSLGGYYRKLL